MVGLGLGPATPALLKWQIKDYGVLSLKGDLCPPPPHLHVCAYVHSQGLEIILEEEIERLKDPGSEQLQWNSIRV